MLFHSRLYHLFNHDVVCVQRQIGPDCSTQLLQKVLAMTVVSLLRLHSPSATPLTRVAPNVVILYPASPHTTKYIIPPGTTTTMPFHLTMCDPTISPTQSHGFQSARPRTQNWVATSSLLAVERDCQRFNLRGNCTLLPRACFSSMLFTIRR